MLVRDIHLVVLLDRRGLREGISTLFLNFWCLQKNSIQKRSRCERCLPDEMRQEFDQVI
jgi:hypothetical protein